MPKVFLFQCEVCGRTKQATNHWWSVAITPGNIAISRFVELPTALYCCGFECLHKLIQEILEKLPNATI